MVFSGTLRSNLDPHDSYPDAELWTALDMSHLKGFVSQLAGGLSHEVPSPPLPWLRAGTG